MEKRSMPLAAEANMSIIFRNDDNNTDILSLDTRPSDRDHWLEDLNISGTPGAKAHITRSDFKGLQNATSAIDHISTNEKISCSESAVHRNYHYHGCEGRSKCVNAWMGELANHPSDEVIPISWMTNANVWFNAISVSADMCFMAAEKGYMRRLVRYECQCQNRQEVSP